VTEGRLTWDNLDKLLRLADSGGEFPQAVVLQINDNISEEEAQLSAPALPSGAKWLCKSIADYQAT